MIVKKYSTFAMKDTVLEYNKSGEPQKTEKQYRVMLVDCLGYSMSANSKIKSQAEQEIARVICNDIDNGVLVLSKDWEQDNL